MTTRREVLKYAGLGAGAAAASALGVPLNAQAEVMQAHAPTKPAQTEITDASGKRLTAGPEIAWSPSPKDAAARDAAAADVTVNPGNTAQTMLGFGAAFTDAACFTLARLSEANRTKLFMQMYGQDQHALSVGSNSDWRERLQRVGIQLRRRACGSGDEKVQHRSRPRLYFAGIARSGERESGFVFVWLHRGARRAG